VPLASFCQPSFFQLRVYRVLHAARVLCGPRLPGVGIAVSTISARSVIDQSVCWLIPAAIAGFKLRHYQYATVPSDRATGLKDCVLAEMIGPIRLPVYLRIVEAVVDGDGRGRRSSRRTRHFADNLHLGGAFQDNRVVPYEGLKADSLSALQRRDLIDLVEKYLAVLPEGPLRTRIAEVERHL
jgi:hypothetical protein